MYYVSGMVNILLLLIIVGLGQRDTQSAVYVLPAFIAVIIAWVTIIRTKKKLQAHCMDSKK